MTGQRTKAGKPRKSRRLRLPFSMGSEGDPEFMPQSTDWQRIEAAYGHPLTTEDRMAIVALVEDYFRWQPGEARAPFADDARRYLDRLEKAARKFWLLTFEAEEGAQTDAARYVQSYIGPHLKSCGSEYRSLLDIMQPCIPAFTLMRDQLKEQIRLGFVEGRAWDRLVWHLTDFATQRDLPIGVSKFDDPQQASPFVAFFRELQRTFAASFQRHEGSNAALAEAITVARREIKRAIARRNATAQGVGS
jgi:hypothetical protein